jgi:DNA-binding protein HU-beta
MATDTPKPMTPTAAVARHIEWLEYALAAARDEEVRRQGRLDKASTKNREKRVVRLAEVKAEVVELAALVTGLKGIQAKTAAPARKPATTPAKRKTAAAAAKTTATAAKPRTTTARKTTARKTTRAASKPSATRRPRRTTAAAPATAAITAPAGPTV